MKSIALIAIGLIISANSLDGQEANYIFSETKNLVSLRAVSCFCIEYKGSLGCYPSSMEDLKKAFPSLIDTMVIYECSFYTNPQTKGMENWIFREKIFNGLRSVLSSNVFQVGDKSVVYCLLESGEVRRLLIED